MITPELLTYIRSELAKGLSRETIHSNLVHGGGWKEEDLQEAFNEVLPPPPPPVVNLVPQAPQPLPIEPEVYVVAPPTLSEPVIFQTPPVVQSVTPPQKHIRYLFWAFITGVLSVVVILAAIFFSPTVFAGVSLVAEAAGVVGFIIPICILSVAAGIFVSASMLHLATKAFKAIQSSWHKAFFCSSIAVAIGIVLLEIQVSFHLPALILILLSLVGFVINITVLSETYGITAFKAFLVGLVQGIFATFIFGVIGLIIAFALPRSAPTQSSTINYGTPSTTVSNTGN